MIDYANSLIEYLVTKGYDRNALSSREIDLYKQHYTLVEVSDKKLDLVIQAFMLMSDSRRSSNVRFPFYKTYSQKTKKGNVIYPGCSIACLSDNGWSFYNASESCEPRTDDYIDYNDAQKRFHDRLKMENALMFDKALNVKCCVCSFMMLTYLILNLAGVSILNQYTLILFSLAILLLILPDLLGALNKISVTKKGIELMINGFD